MSLRVRLLLVFAAVVFVPLAIVAGGLRTHIVTTLTDDYEADLGTIEQAIESGLKDESAAIGERLGSLERALQTDSRFRSGAVAGLPLEQPYVVDYAETAMRLSGLSVLQLHDENGRIVSSGHFRNEHGREDAALVAALASAPGGAALIDVRTPQRELLALVRRVPLEIAGRTFALIGGTTVDGTFLQALAQSPGTVVELRYPGGSVTSSSGSEEGPSAAAGAPGVREIENAAVFLQRRADGSLDAASATLTVVQPRAQLAELLRRADALLLFTAAATGAVALLLAVWISGRISRPLEDLAARTAVLDLDRLDVPFEGGSGEVGQLTRVLGDLSDRLRASAARIRDAERRATIGDLARQVNHDIKNGLIPLRNVMRHLAQVERDDPAAVRAVLAERRGTIDSSLAYLETLAANYERLAPAQDRRATDLNTVVADAARGASERAHVELHTELAPDLPAVQASPVAMRRVLENLIANAADSLESAPGRITISTALVRRDGEAPVVRLMVADTGRGMTQEETGRMFDDFYTTKASGTGLGLSIVRRLVMDVHGTIRVESRRGAGTRVIVDIPAGRPSRAAEIG